MSRIYPLSGAFMVIALMGLIFSGIMFAQSTGDVLEGDLEIEDKGYDRDKTMLFTLVVLFGLMFIAAIISLTFGPDSEA